MPALSPTMEEGKLSKWLVKEGDVEAGTILAEIETDKATMEFEAVDEGKIGQILVAEGTEGVKVNAPIATLSADGEAPGAAPAKKAERPNAGRSAKGAEAPEAGRNRQPPLHPKSKSPPSRKSPPAPNSSTRPCATPCATPWRKKCAATSWCS